MRGISFPAEWFPQSGVQVTWPHQGTDWSDILEEVTQCYISFSREILKREKLLVVCRDAEEVRSYFTRDEQENLLLTEIESNDTWARDHGGIAVFEGGKPVLIDFGFNAWGLKFAAYHDNLITSRLYDKSVFRSEVIHRNRLDFILEGGSIESDGKGTILTTTQCLLSPNRNDTLNQVQIEEQLKESLGANWVLWLHHGYLEGDDTDSHIDTLARFCDEHTIAYVKCDDKEDVHFEELQAMEEELKAFATPTGNPYRLIALPMADALYYEGNRLPATYANFLIINGAVLLPFYDSPKDEEAMQQLQLAFPDREIIGVDCRPLVKQHGSLHCVTMQYPLGFL